MTSVYCVWERPANKDIKNLDGQDKPIDQIVMPMLFKSKLDAIKYLNKLVIDQNKDLGPDDPANLYHVFTTAELKLRLKFWKKRIMIGCVVKSKDDHLSIWMCNLRLY
jgi:hypothetical protein